MSSPFCARRARPFQAALLCATFPFLLLAEAAQAQGITLADALSRVALGDPSVAANAAQLQISHAAIRQAEVRPRDVVGVDVEDFAGSGPYSPVSRTQATAWYERTWERGGKRQARIDAGRADADVTAQRGRLRMLDLLAEVQSAWVEALAAEAAIGIAAQQLADARRVQAEVDRRTARALDPAFAAERARTTVAQAGIALDQAREGARIARAHLAGYWGGGEDYRLDTRPFTATTTDASAVGQVPDVSVLSATLDAADVRIRLAESGSVADPSARIGVRHFGDGNDVALMVGGSIPLGNRSANRANIDRARAERLAAEAELAVTRVESTREINRLTAERAAIATEVARIDREVLPSAERAVTLVESGFRRGGTAFTFLEVSQTQQAAIGARARRIELLRRYHLSGARLDRLTGRHTPLLSSAEIRQ